MSSAVLVNGESTDKPWMVMVHGMSQDHRVFSSQVEAFRSAYRILLVDLPGHGLSAALGGPFGIVEFADHVHATLSAKGVAHANYWGTHTGATVALYLAAHEPGLFRSLILEGPGIPGENPTVVVAAIAKARAAARQAGLAAALAGWWGDSCWFDYMRANPIHCRAEEHHAIVASFGGRPWTHEQAAAPVPDVKPLLPRIDVPTLIYNGAGDHADFQAITGYLAETMPRARQATVEHSGGFPAWENPHATNRLVAGFLSEIGTA